MAHRASVAIIVGSLRRASFSRKCAQYVLEHAKASLKCRIVEIGDLPLYNEDLDADPPKSWCRFREEIAQADALLFVTPEYNRSIPGVLKNAIDIGSRPPGKSSFLGKPIGLIGTSPGAHGGVSAVKHLQQILPGFSGPIMQQPEIYLGTLGAAFDDKGELIKDDVKQFVSNYLQAFATWIDRFHK